MRDDSELLRQYASNRSNEAFAELVSRHIGAVYSVALRRVAGDTHLADDITQEVFTDLSRKAARLCHREALVGWLFVATRFAAAKAVRHDQRLQSLHQKAGQMIELDLESAGEPAWEELRPVLDDAIHGLKERDREAILLHFFDKRSFGELGAELSLTESGARMRVERALDKLRQSLARRGIRSTGAALAGALGSQATASVPSTLASSVTATALAAAAPAGGIALFSLMSITKAKLCVALGVVLAGAAIMWVSQQNQIARLRAERSALMTQADANAKAAARLKAELADAEDTLAKMRAHHPAAGVPGGSATANDATDQDSPMETIHERQILKDHPEYAGLMRKELRRSTVRQYERAIAALNLQPDEAGKLKELLVEKAYSISDARDAAIQQGFSQNSPEMNQATAQAGKEMDQEINALIGGDAAGRLEALQGTMYFGGQNSVDLAGVDLADAGVPLTTTQSQTLSQMLHDLQSHEKNPDSAQPGFNTVDPATWQSPSDQQFFAKASTLLTANQLQILEAYIAEQNQQNSIRNSYRKSPNAGLIIVP
jgi:RNA polymerase sigma factor (sigma-70 family)